MTSDYKTDLKRAVDELAGLYSELGNLEIKIARQQRRVAALKSLAEGDAEFEIAPDPSLGGLTESISSVLKAAFPTPLTTFEIREHLIALHFPVHNYKNFRGSLHTVLKRLIDGQLVDRQTDLEIGEPAYRWATVIRPDRLIDKVRRASSPAHDSGMRGSETPADSIEAGLDIWKKIKK